MSVKIIDLSNNNQDPDWRQVYNAGISCVWLKVTEGTSFVDQTFASRAVKARAAGLRVGGYHFGRPGSDAASQSSFFAHHLGPVGPHDLRPALDLETADGQPARTIETFARSFNHELVRLIHVGPLFYSYTGFVESLRLQVPVGYGLWLADYGADNGSEHPVTVPAPWRKAVAHQYSSRGTVPGCPHPVDVSSAPDLRPLLAHPGPV